MPLTPDHMIPEGNSDLAIPDIGYVTGYTATKDEYDPNYGRDQSGYGRKIATPYKIVLNGEKRQRRVYAVCFSNNASYYVVIGKVSHYLRDSELETALEM